MKNTPKLPTRIIVSPLMIFASNLTSFHTHVYTYHIPGTFCRDINILAKHHARFHLTGKCSVVMYKIYLT